MGPFATNLRTRAGELGLSNAEVARRAGLSERRYGNYVSGRREPDLTTLVRIAQVLDSTPDQLLSFEGEPVSTGSISGSRIISAMSGLPQSDLDALAIMVEALANARLG